MSSFSIAIGIGILITICLVVIFLTPDEKAIAQKKKEEKKEKKRAKLEVQNQPTKDWEKVAERTQAQLHTAKNELGHAEKKVRELQKQVLAEGVKIEKLKEKYLKEKSWIEKKESDVGKKEEGMNHIKVELKKMQDLYTEEHVGTIRLTKELEQLKKEHELTVEQRRLAESECAQVKAKNDSYRLEIAHLKKDVANLTKKQDADTFVSRSEFVKLEIKLKETKKELERVARQSNESE